MMVKDKLKKALEEISDSYDYFVEGILRLYANDAVKQLKMLDFIKSHPTATSSQIVEYSAEIDGIKAVKNSKWVVR